MGAKAVTKSNRVKWIKTGIILSANVLLWVVPSNVAYLIAQNRHVLLGRYSVGHLTALLLLIPISVMLLYLAWSSEKNEKERKFKVMGILISVFASLVVMDIAARLMLPKRYVAEQNYFYRPPNTTQTGTVQDVPEEAFLYPQTPPGYPDIEYTLAVDKRGFRNKTDLEQYDIVVLGDSFAEGSRVTDEHTWPVLLTQETDLTVYNLGMSAGHPGTYLETLKKFGPELSPKTIVCMLYEGNDFRDSNYRNKDRFSEKLELYFKESPIRNALKQALIRSFGSAPRGQETNAKAPDAAQDTMNAVSWLPIALPQGPNAKYYTFKIKRLLEHFVTKQEFLSSKGTTKTFAALREIKNLCARKAIRLIIVYAPDKPHTLLPLIGQAVPPEQLRAFMALKQRRLPPAEELMDTLLARLDVQEFAVRDFCKAESIEFVSLTKPLRQAIASGIQAYFTYDQHWTPPGHEIVAENLGLYIRTDRE